jgi:hypothetical protein
VEKRGVDVEEQASTVDKPSESVENPPAAVETRWASVGGVWLLRLSVALVVSAAVAGLSSALLSVVAGRLNPAFSFIALVLGGVIGVVAGRSLSLVASDVASNPPALASRLAVIVFLVVALRHFLWVCFESGPSIETLLPNNYGDLPLHWTYVAFLARGAPFWPENPIAAGERLRYPFGMDLVSALAVQLGLGVPFVFRATGLVAAAVTAHALHMWGRGFAVAAFLFSGGWVGFGLAHAAGLLDPAASLAWKNLFLALFVPQRGFLFALPAGLLLLWSWRRRFLRGEAGLPPWVEGVLWGAMPLFHLHTFLFVSVVGALWAVSARRVKEAWPALAWALVPATWSVFEVTEGFRSASLVWWKPGWVIESQNPVIFLAVNFGLWLPVVVVALGRACRRRDREALLTIGPGLGLFVLLFFLMLAPWDWDNTKVMLWCFLIVLPSTFALVLRPLALSLRAGLVVLLLLPGAVTVVRASLPSGPRIVVADRVELEGVCAAVSALDPADRVAVAPTFNHPVGLCGQAIPVGYGGHLWSHGIDGRELERKVQQLMWGEPGWAEAARALDVHAIFWGAREHQAYPSSPRPWASSGRRIASGPWGDLFLVRPDPTPDR